MYIPKRFIKNTVSDCKERGIECELGSSERRFIYIKIPIPEALRETCSNLYSVSLMRSVRSMLAPVYGDGFQKYCTVSVTACMFLKAGNRRHTIMDDGSTLTIRGERKLELLPLYIEGDSKSCNGVAGDTSSNDGNNSPIQKRSS